VSFVEVAIAPPQPFGGAFTYTVPDGLLLVPGDAVLVPFGPRTTPAIVVSASAQSSFAGEPRAVIERIGDRPLLDAAHVQLALWLAARCRSSPSVAMALMLPRGAREPADFLLPPLPAIPVLCLTADAASVLRALGQVKSPARAMRVASALLDAGGALPLSRLRAEYGLTSAVHGQLIELGLAEERALPIEAAEIVAPLDGPPLTPAQSEAAATIAASPRGSAFLLHGVTGSGKTEVYLAALADVVARGGQGIVLVPEIALTPQTERRFSERFPGRVAVLHGRLSRERHRALWHGVRRGAFDVVVGPRSALFAPLPRIGLIVLDEEHEPSFKQSDPSPRYHAREVAGELARLTEATLVLGSATPDVGTFARSRSGALQTLSLPSRLAPGEGMAREWPLPVLEVVDMARELREGNSHVLSRALDGAIGDALTAGEQVLLFLNRRGSASLLLCRDCGFAPRCPRCAIAYALHTVTRSGVPRLICHHCNRSRGVPARCPECGGVRLRPVGVGTQRLEELVQERYPSARVVRWDADTAGTHGRQVELGDLVTQRGADIVVGTQMIAKGHDFGGVTVVGVVSADLSLNVPDFRAAERTFQLLVQVAGRAGRRGQAARIVVQTYAPDHYAVRAAAAGDYEAFYEREIAFRREMAYPPAAPLTRLVVATGAAESAEAEAQRYAAALRTEKARLGLPGPDIVGPAPCYFAKLNNRYRWQLLLRGAAINDLLDAAPPPSRWSIDVEPVDLL
jgi:primosomal protein N' (replication factor Y) (superfamily II helicase)